MPRARRSGGNISAAAARESRTIDCAAPQSASPRKTSTPDSSAQPAAVTTGPPIPSTKPVRITGIRPTRSEIRPAGPTASRAGEQEDGGAEAEDPLDAGDGDDRHRPERDRELDHPRLEDEPEREQRARCGGRATSCD